MTTPQITRAISIASNGGPGQLQLTSEFLRPLKAGEVLIKVAAAGVNRPDIMQRQGLYPPPAGASAIPGLEISGEIIACGRGVSSARIGELVCALITGGGYAEYAIAEGDLCLPIPAGLNMLEAASLPEVFFTSWSNLIDRGSLQAGEKVLIHGGSSGIGTAAIQLAKHWGSEVFITAGNQEKCDFCKQLGADHAINYKSEDFVDVILEKTHGRGVNLILDIIGGNYLQRNLKALSEDGRLVQIALQQGPKTEINLLPILLKRITLTGSTLRARPTYFKAEIAQNLQATVWPLLAQKRIKPIIYRTFPMEKAAEAHALMENSTHMGKIVLEMQS